jgi:methanogenic corrinoid protein MtbC1
MTSSYENQSAGWSVEADRQVARGFGDDKSGWRPNWSKVASDAPPVVHDRASDALLLRVIEGEIIPRLLLAHNGPPQDTDAVPQIHTPLASALDIEAFARLVLNSEPGEIADNIQGLIEQGALLQQIYLDLLAPVARLLGIYWQEDRCTFTDVTLGLSRLHFVVHELGRRSREALSRSAAHRAAFFAPAPGEQHTFGLAILEELFQHAGWRTASDHGGAATSVTRALASEAMDLVGFSVGCERFLDPLSALIAQLRSSSRNRDVVVMLGGRVFADHPDLGANLGADSVLREGDDAVGVAEQLVAENQRRCGKRVLM